MPAVSKEKKRLRGLILAALEPYYRLGYAVPWSISRIVLESLLAKATLSETQQLIEIFQTQWGIKVIPEQEETEHD